MGMLRHKVRVLKPVKAGQDKAGADITTWEPIATVYAAIQPQKTIENQVMGQVSQGKRSIKMTMIYMPGIDRQCQIDFNGRLYSVNSIQNIDERSREMILEVSEFLKPNS